MPNENRVDVLKSGGVTHGHCYDVYLNWKLVDEIRHKGRPTVLRFAQSLARTHNAKLHFTG